MTIEKSISGNEITLSVSGWLDTQAAGDLGNELSALSKDITSMILDLKKLEYISSSGVRQVVAAHKKMGGKLVVKNAPENVLNVFKSIGIDKRINFE